MVHVVVLGLACIEEWGKLFALCEPGVVERNGEEAKTLSYQERFVQFQAFLQDCDEDDHSSLLDGELEDGF